MTVTLSAMRRSGPILATNMWLVVPASGMYHLSAWGRQVLCLQYGTREYSRKYPLQPAMSVPVTPASPRPHCQVLWQCIWPEKQQKG